MCYSIDIKIIPLQGKTIPAFGSDLLNSKELKLSGQFPNFSIHDGHCACDILKNSRSSFGNAAEVFERILLHRDVKKVAIVKYWTNELSLSPATVKLNLQQFQLKNANAELQSAVWYEVLDQSKFVYSN